MSLVTTAMFVAVAQRLAQRQRERRLAGADRAADADAQRRMIALACIDQERKRRVYCVSWRAESEREARARSCELVVRQSRSRSATTPAIRSAQREQHALAVGLPQRHRLHRRQHLVLDPRPEIGRRARRAGSMSQCGRRRTRTAAGNGSVLERGASPSAEVLDTGSASE